MNKPFKLLILVGSPRRTGNSATLAEAVQRGAEAAGTEVLLRFIDDFIRSNSMIFLKKAGMALSEYSVDHQRREFK